MPSWQQIHESGNRAFCSGLFEAALNNYLQALDLAQQCADLSFIGESWRGLAKTYLQLDKVEEALHAAREADSTDREFWGYENQQVCEDMFLLAEALRRTGELGQARDLFARVLELRIMLAGEMHDDTLEVLVRLIWLDLQEGREESLDSLTQRAVHIFAALHPAGAFTKALNIKVFLQPYMEQNRQQEAEAISRRLQQTLRNVLGSAHPEIRQALADCSAVMKSANRHMAAWHLQTRADVIQKKEQIDRFATPPSGPSIVVDGVPVLIDPSNPELAKERAQHVVLAQAHDTNVSTMPWNQLCDQAQKALASGLYDAALTSFLGALAAARRADDQPSISETLRHLAQLYLHIGSVAEAQKAATEAAEIDRSFWGSENPQLSSDEFLLAEALRRQGSYAEARELLQSVLALRSKIYGEDHSETLSALIRLIWLDLQQDRQDSLLQDMRLAAEVFAKCQTKESFSEVLDLKFFLQPYMEHPGHEVESLCHTIQSAARTVFGGDHKEIPLIDDDCAAVMKSLQRAQGEPRFKLQHSQSAAGSHAHASSPATTYSAARGNVSSPDRSSHADDGHVAPSEHAASTITRSSSKTLQGALIHVCGNSLKQAGLAIEAKSFLWLSLCSSLVICLISSSPCIARGHFDWAIESAAMTFLAVGALIFSCIGVMSAVRQQTFAVQLPNALEVIVSLLQAGTPISEALESVAKTMPMPIAAEFERVVVALKEGRNNSQAFALMTERVRVPQLAELADAINANRSSGASLAKQVAIIAKELREAEKERALLRKSLGAMVLLAVVMVIGVFRFIFDIAFNPDGSAPILDSLGTKVILFIVYAAPIALLIFARGNLTATDGSVKLPGAKLYEFFRKQIMKDKLRSELAKFLDLVVMYVESGVPFPHAVQMVRKEASSSCPTLSQELDDTLNHLTSFKSSLPQAFRKIGEQYGVDELITLAATLDAASRSGGSIGFQLTEQSKSLRDHLAKTGKARASSAYSLAMLVGVALFSIFFLILKIIEHAH